MPRYYFHVRDGQYIPDEAGTELRDLPAAHTEAVKLAGEMLRDHKGSFLKWGEVAG